MSKRLSNAAGMRNVLAHGYDEIDPKIVHASINQVLKDFVEFIDLLKDA